MISRLLNLNKIYPKSFSISTRLFSNHIEGLTSDQIDFFHKNGYLHIPNFWSIETCDAMRKRSQEYLIEFAKDASIPKSIFTTNDQTRKSDEYFLSSGDKIRYFLEEDACTDDGTLLYPPEKAVNKIGHALHIMDPLFREHSFSIRVCKILKSLGYIDPLAVQSMYIFKQPSIGGYVRPHQDGSYLYTKPHSVIGLWWALEDCTLENGCLWAVPGSHRREPITLRAMANEDRTKMILDPPITPEFDLTGSVSLETKKGSLVLLHHALVHYSEANKSPYSRHAYTMHVVEGHKTEYPKNNWLQYPPEKSFPHLYEIANQL